MWIYLPISVSSAASADSTLPLNWLFQKLSVCAMWRSKFLRLASWRRAWKTAPWIRHLSGVTLEPSQQDSIVAEWLEQFSVSPARICLSQESKRALKVGPEADSSTTAMRVVREVGCEWCFLENVPPVLAFPAGHSVLRELAESGFDAEWVSVRASDVGAPHKRERVFILAHRTSGGLGMLRESSRRAGFVGGGSRHDGIRDRLAHAYPLTGAMTTADA